ncbi:MAG: xanthine dehydrogenase family protein subunit M [Syntrophorhabdaceae bacterium]|nr:xanthine dehydrogenase family protein subunit M [Syntrophorhabdaceae bacterium]
MAIFYRRLPKFRYVSPKTVEEALDFLGNHKNKAKVMAGGTDLIPQLKSREIPPPEYVVDIKGIQGLEGISYDGSTFRIGALCTINRIGNSDVIQSHFPSIVQAAQSMASPQVRNRGTFGGNICNGVPSADSAPPLLTLSAEVTIKGPGGERVIPLERFFTGPKKTSLEGDELLIDISIPKPEKGSRGVYLKLSPRHSMDLAIVGVAAWGTYLDGVCTDIKIGLGAVAPTPMRAIKAEGLIKGQKVTPDVIEEAARVAGSECSPIDDFRASAEYRRDMVYILTKRALNRIFS